MAALIGHRGAPALAPENTLQGIRKAHSCGAEMVEMDVRLSSDGVLVLMHDETVDRTTNGSGRVEDLSIGELRGLDAGGEPVPTLKEALRLAEVLGIQPIVEMKEEGLEELLLEELVGLNAVVTSFYHRSVLELSELLREKKGAEGIKTGIIISSLPVNPVDLALDAHADAIFPKRVSPNIFKIAHKSGLKVYPWTVNTPERAAWLLRLGADGIVTDDPCAIRDVLKAPPRNTGQENCEYYPCHHFEGQDCTHCFCPLYPCKDPELGRFVRTKRGKRFWSCIDCVLVHIPEVARYLEANPDAGTEELKNFLGTTGRGCFRRADRAGKGTGS
ncbi:glycerophosphodiester phosphodiesterase family protein [Methanothrix sp.]|uniref:glycerophosphodiester phosphodiesterase family protein n=1 Tax=Methanothrix sp. TaxID=90426 RepID=UPI00257C296D|nr:glycerophosphodiester phosphodiesterase family protein [Methanothrix sp.]